ncbi:MAG: GTP pyrophosphokinase family protein [Solobacterium sp.]|jgi:putative GTP pyrophosphokinase|nr:GTP pyrophosphokinase family protein [Solobacterium sp.]
MPNTGLKKEHMVDYAEYMDLHAKLERTPGFFHYYRFAMEDLETRFSMLNEYFSLAGEQSPIVDIRTRLKTFDSIFEKLKRRGFPVTVQSITENLYDVAGVRVICPFIDDVYCVADTLLKQEDIVLIEKKDYIMFPKNNGYRSLHLLIELPVVLPPGRRMIKAEVQLRTIAMEFWANLEHKMRYKRDMDPALLKGISDELKECAVISNELDRRMQQIHYRIEGEEEEEE